MKRIIADIVLAVLLLAFPYWVGMLAAAAFFFAFPRFYELIAAGFLIDALYGAPLPRFFGFQFGFSLSALILFVVLWQVKRRMRI